MSASPATAGDASLRIEAASVSQDLETCVMRGDVEGLAAIIDQVGSRFVQEAKVSILFLDYGAHMGTLLHLACQWRQTKVVQLLLENGLMSDKESLNFHITPLHVSAACGDLDTCKLLIASGAPVSAVDWQMKAPLHMAAKSNHFDVVQALLEHGADPNLATKTGGTPLHYASLGGNDSVVQLLVDHGAKVNFVRAKRRSRTALHSAIGAGQVSTALLLIKLGARTESVSADHNTALLLAISNEQWKVAAALLGNFPGPNLVSVSSLLQGMLHSAVLGQCRKNALAVYQAGEQLAAATDVARTKLSNLLLWAAEETRSTDLPCSAEIAGTGGSQTVVDFEIIGLVTQLLERSGEHSFDQVLSALPSTETPTLTPEIACDLLQLVLEKSHLAGRAKMAEIACQAGALTFMESANQDGKEGSVSLAEGQCLAAACPVSLELMKHDVLKLALTSGSARLAEIACESGALPRSSRQAEKVLELGIENASVELIVATVTSKPAAVSSLEKQDFDTLVGLALEERSEKLLVHACQAKALFSKSTDLEKGAVLSLALSSSVELAEAACQPGVLERQCASIVDDVLQFGLKTVSLALVTAACEARALNKASNETRGRVLHFALQKHLVGLTIAALSSADLALADSDMLDRALQLGVRTSSSALLTIICRAGVLARSTDSAKEQVLRTAAVTGDLQLANYCILSGTLHNADHWESPSPLDIAWQRGHSRLYYRLQRALDDQRLVSLGTRDANTVLLRVAGPPGAGKSTLVRSLKRPYYSHFLRGENQADEGDKNFHKRTRGIKVHTLENKDGTRYRILDFGGHDDFATANQLFVGQGSIPAINTIVISSLTNSVEMEEQVLEWSAFYASRCEHPNLCGESQLPGTSSSHEAHNRPLLQPVIVVATRSDSAVDGEVENVEGAFRRAKLSYGKFLDFQDRPVFVDARKSWVGGTLDLRRVLENVKKAVLQRAPPQAALCNYIQHALPWIRQTAGCPVISRIAFPDLVARGLSSWLRRFDTTVLLSHSELFDAALRQMSDACEILSFPDIPELKYMIVIDPSWLLTDVVGVLLSPSRFPPPRVSYDKHGRTDRKLAEEVLEEQFRQNICTHVDSVSGAATLQMVTALGISILDNGDQAGTDSIVIASKLDICRNVGPTLSKMQSSSAIWFGIRLQCKDVPLSVCLFPQLQVHLYNYFLEQCAQKPSLWSGGIAVALHFHNAVGLVEVRRGRMAIDIIVLGEEDSRRACYALLQTLKEQTLLKADTFSPGSDITEKILSSAELSSLDWSDSPSTPRIAYEKDDVEAAMKGSGKIGPKEIFQAVEDAHALMAIPPNHVQLMTKGGYERFCHKMNRSSKWHYLAHSLGMPEHTISAAQTASNPTDAVLQWWSRRSGHHTVNQLLAEVQAIDCPSAAAVLQKELTFSMNILSMADEADRWDMFTDDDDSLTSTPRLPEAMLLKIANCFTDLYTCAYLAVFLDLSQQSGFFFALQSTNPHITPSEAAFKVLKKWMEEKAGERSLGERLYKVLYNDLNMAGVAEQFKDDLLE